MEFDRLKEHAVFSRIIVRVKARRIAISVLDPSKQLEDVLNPILERERRRMVKSGALMSAEFTKWMARDELRIVLSWKVLWSKLSGDEDWTEDSDGRQPALDL